LVGTSAWISSMMTVSTERSASRAFDVSSRYSDSGVVIRMSAGSRWNRARSARRVAGADRDRRRDGTASPRAAATVGDAGERRAQVALDVDRQRLERRDVEHAAALGFGGGARRSNISRLRHHRNAVSVLPLPVGARISVDSPRAIAGQPSCCGASAPRKASFPNDQQQLADETAHLTPHTFGEELKKITVDAPVYASHRKIPFERDIESQIRNLRDRRARVLLEKNYTL
jgi:hypothetical protein